MQIIIYEGTALVKFQNFDKSDTRWIYVVSNIINPIM